MAGGGRKPDSKYQFSFPSQSISFDPDAFNEFLNLQGVRLVHYKSLRCPVGLTDVDDNRRPHDDHSGCSNGFIYYKAGVVTAGMQGNGNQQHSSDMGLMESSYITATLPQYYDETEDPIVVAPFDRFFLEEQEHDARIVVPTWHLQVCSQSRLDKLYFPAVSVEKLVDFRGVEYFENIDFCIENGLIKWTANNWPGYQTDTGRGAVYSIRYNYRPYWYVSRILHEIRVAQVDTIDGRLIKRMPQQILLAREYTFTNESADPNAKDSNSLRQTPSPADGGFGPR